MAKADKTFFLSEYFSDRTASLNRALNRPETIETSIGRNLRGIGIY